MPGQTVFAKLDPRTAAEQIAAEHEPAWLDAFTEHLDRRRFGRSLARTLSVWGLSQAEAARLLGVSRQAVGKWLEKGVPSERLELVSDLAASTDLLVRYLKRDRIPAIVRRPIPLRDGDSLVQLLSQGRSSEVLETCRDMFDFARTHG